MNYNDITLLQEYLEHDSIKDDVLKSLERVKKEKVLKVHKYAITVPKDCSKRWQTYVKGDDKRKRISSFSEEGLYNKLYDHYYKVSIVCLEGIYDEWIKYRRIKNLSPRTIKRNHEWWNKYYKDDPIVKVPLVKLKLNQIEDFFYKSIKKYDITSKELSNMKSIFSSMMKMARSKGYIMSNIFLDVNISTYGCRPSFNHNDSSRIYLECEKERLFKELNKDLINNPNVTDSYAIFLIFKLGLRIGEVSALKVSDIDYNNREIHIHRMETLAEDANGDLRPFVAEYTKKKSPYGDRYLPLSDYELNIITEVLKVNDLCGYMDQDYLFLDENGRTKNREIDNRIRKLCNLAGIEVKSAHDIRRTVASEMYSNGIAIQDIRDYLGHANIKTTWSYIYNIEGKEETARKIVNSLNNMNGFKRIQNC